MPCCHLHRTRARALRRRFHGLVGRIRHRELARRGTSSAGGCLDILKGCAGGRLASQRGCIVASCSQPRALKFSRWQAAPKISIDGRWLVAAGGWNRPPRRESACEHLAAIEPVLIAAGRWPLGRGGRFGGVWHCIFGGGQRRVSLGGQRGMGRSAAGYQATHSHNAPCRSAWCAVAPAATEFGRRVSARTSGAQNGCQRRCPLGLSVAGRGMPKTGRIS